MGRRFGPRVFSRPDSRLFRQEHALRAQEFFARHGSRAVVLGRFVPVVRTFVPVVAGVGRMPRHTFTVFNLLGALVWAIGITTVGFFFGGIPFVAHHIEAITIAIASFSVVPAALELCGVGVLAEPPRPRNRGTTRSDRTPWSDPLGRTAGVVGPENDEPACSSGRGDGLRAGGMASRNGGFVSLGARAGGPQRTLGSRGGRRGKIVQSGHTGLCGCIFVQLPMKKSVRL